MAERRQKDIAKFNRDEGGRHTQSLSTLDLSLAQPSRSPAETVPNTKPFYRRLAALISFFPSFLSPLVVVLLFLYILAPLSDYSPALRIASHLQI
jgi:hypothetical protein